MSDNAPNQTATISLDAKEMDKGQWYLTSTTLPGFRYLIHADDDLATALRLMVDFSRQTRQEQTDE